MDTSHNIGYLLQHLSFTMGRHNDQYLQEQLGIGVSQFKILMVLQWNPHIKQRQIANELGQTEASISRQIKLMHDKGLLVTTISPNNRREHITTLTAKGLRVTEASTAILNRIHAPMFERLSERQQQQLIEMLEIMHDFACPSSQRGQHI